MISQIAEKEDNHVTTDIQNYHYGSLQFTRTDAVAIALQVMICLGKIYRGKKKDIRKVQKVLK